MYGKTLIKMPFAHDSAVLRTLPLSGSLNRRICGSAFGYAQIPQSGTSHIPRTLYEMFTSGAKYKNKKYIYKEVIKNE